jgi:histidine triad (HIT) family protein
MEESVFTKIIKGEIPCHSIYEDEHTIAFLDVHPLAEGHTLLVPKLQVDHIWDLDEAAYAHLWTVARKLGGHIREVLEPARVGIIVEGFSVPHVHIHLIPINSGKDLKKSPDMAAPINHEALSAVAEMLRLA